MAFGVQIKGPTFGDGRRVMGAAAITIIGVGRLSTQFFSPFSRNANEQGEGGMTRFPSTLTSLIPHRSKMPQEKVPARTHF